MMELLAPKEESDKLLAAMTSLNASDLHLKVGYEPYFRIAGLLRKVDTRPLPDSDYVEKMLEDLVPPTKKEQFHRGDIDFSSKHAVTGDRFRINVFRSTGEMHAAIRRVQNKIPSYEDLHLPKVFHDVVSKLNDGLIIVSGVTGSGKSSTLAAMMDHLNATQSLHMITIEDPVEYQFRAKKSIISQREIGIDIDSFASALRYVVRQDPDCILIGEMRDRETMMAAIQAAETGHIVLGSLHVSDACQSFARILEFFPRNEHAFIRSSLSNSLRSIMVQRLLPGIDEGSRYPATEVLLVNSVVKDKILHEEDEDIPAIISQCRDEGMRSFTDSLCELVMTEKVHYDTAMEYAPSREALASAVKGIKTSAQSLVNRVRSKG